MRRSWEVKIVVTVEADTEAEALKEAVLSTRLDVSVVNWRPADGDWRVPTVREEEYVRCRR